MLWSYVVAVLPECAIPTKVLSPKDTYQVLDPLTFHPGNGVTELSASCAFNNVANRVGPFCFTYALISQLRKLVQMPSFTVGYLFNLNFTGIQNQ